MIETQLPKVQYQLFLLYMRLGNHYGWGMIKSNEIRYKFDSYYYHTERQ